MTRTPTIEEAIDMRVARAFARFDAVGVGHVVAYDDDTQRGEVQIVADRAYTGRDGERTTERRATLTDVPFACVGYGGRRIKMPIAVGDPVVVLFCSHAIERWKANGAVGDQGIDRRGAPSDAIAICGLQATATDGDPLIEFTADGKINAGGSSALATKADLDALISSFNAFVTTYNGHTHLDPASGSTGTPSAPGSSAGASTGTLVLKGS